MEVKKKKETQVLNCRGACVTTGDHLLQQQSKVATTLAFSFLFLRCLKKKKWYSVQPYHCFPMLYHPLPSTLSPSPPSSR